MQSGTLTTRLQRRSEIIIIIIIIVIIIWATRRNRIKLPGRHSFILLVIVGPLGL
jgi:hypothetical protein